MFNLSWRQEVKFMVLAAFREILEPYTSAGVTHFKFVVPGLTVLQPVLVKNI